MDPRHAADAPAYGVPVERDYVYRVGPRAFDERQLALGKRSAEVVLALRRPSGRFLLHTKSFYPAGVYRLLSGGVRAGEAVPAAAERELREETGLGGRVLRYLAVQHHTFCLGERRVPFTSHILLMAGDAGTPVPDDAGEQITAFRDATLGELLQVAAQLESLPDDWADWGRFRATAHRLVVELLHGAEANS